MVQRLDTSLEDFEHRFAALLAAKRESAADVQSAVSAIIADVIARGDDALVELTPKFDHFELTPATMRLAPAARERAFAEASPKPLAAPELAHYRVRACQE